MGESNSPGLANVYFWAGVLIFRTWEAFKKEVYSGGSCLGHWV